ncbi:hypothetical protein SPRG_03214 [Saprolegnia parasitica CBS 223.65]|uniref:ZZ-type domain-containing protein n=1 Tax=Saprolegnia parasitica (strain CBS 223.65) TaxID=695850 RepID=A0A067CYV7_SAPPC|nr:hypothetical protein SPRG_03214 [Saprolegnia parasitica CBS 223.65]KDO31997.1 hypothetical protein SPRG_03214 [Saprolegnia parasitica CBS 223.65]|eukprot:XP_012197191.1 hypothetical protein SPRG_03214 [Saprolegnia parasitica CBS 223.65]
MSSRFSLTRQVDRNSGRRDSTVDHSAVELNRRLSVEQPAVTSVPHFFVGPATPSLDKDAPVRALHGERKIVKSKVAAWLDSEPQDEAANAVGMTRFQAAGRYFGMKVASIAGAMLKDPDTQVNPDSFCDGCGMDPIVGHMYTCSQCDNYNLCTSCYRSGIHGYENSALLKAVREDYAVMAVVEQCKQLVPDEVFTLLMKQVCRGQVDRFKFLANWICGVVLGNSISTLSVRGIEIPHLGKETRARLVELLTPPLSEREDIEVSMEWFTQPDEGAISETLRIWVCTDKETKSPFAPRTNSPIIYSPGAGPILPPSPSASDLLSPPSSIGGLPTNAPPSPPGLDLPPVVSISQPNSPATKSPPMKPKLSSPIPRAELRHDESLDGPCTPRFAADDDELAVATITASTKQLHVAHHSY